MKARIITVCLLALAPIGISRAASLATWDFEAQPAGTTPSVRGIVTHGTALAATVTVIDATTKPADPFGKGRNHSLYVARTTESKTAAQVQFSLPDGKPPVESGTASFDLLVVGTAEIPGLIEIDLGMLEEDAAQQRTQSIAALQIWTNSDITKTSTRNAPGYFLSFSGGVSGTENLYAFNEQVPVGKKTAIAITWDAAKGIYGVTLNGRKASRGSGDSLTSQLDATRRQPGVNSIRFKTANTSATAFFIDNITFQSASGTTKP